MITLFCRLPAPGRAKTRLAASIAARGAAERDAREAAAAAYAAMLGNALAQAARACACAPRGCTRRMDVSCSDARDLAALSAWASARLGAAPHSVSLQEQSPDLGARMAAALLRGHRGRCLVAGTDVPGLSAAVLARALALLGEGFAASPGPRRADVVLGAARDGGFYLIGVAPGAANQVERVFAGVRWSSADVLARVLRNAAALAPALRVDAASLPVLADVDAVDDIALWEAEGDSSGSAGEMRAAFAACRRLCAGGIR